MTFSDNTNEGEKGSRTDVPSSLKAAKGILLSLMSAICFAFSGEFTALAHKGGIPSFQIIFLKRLTEMSIVVPIVAFSRQRLTGENRHQNIILVIFVIVANVANVLNHLSFTFPDPGIAFGIIKGSMPVFVACIAFLCLREQLFIVDFCAILISLTGVVLVAVGMTHIATMSTKPLVLSIVIPLLSSFVSAPDMVIMRYLTGTLGMPIFTALLYQDLVGAVALLVITYAAETPVWTMSLRTALYVVGLGVTKSLGNIVLFESLKVIKAYVSTAVGIFVIPITILLDYLFLQTVPNSLQIAGVVLVMVAVLITSVYTWLIYRRKELQRTLLETLLFHPDER